MSLADFSINGDLTSQGFDGTIGQVLTFALRTAPVNGIRTWQLQVFSASTFNSSAKIAQNPPRASKSAPTLTLVGATSGQAVSPATLSGTITTTLPGTKLHAWIIRSVVNGGVDANGQPSPALIRERIVTIRDAFGNRPPVPTETTQYEDTGWAGTIRDFLSSLSSVSAVSSVFGRTGVITAASGDYTSTQVTNASAISGSTVTAALNNLPSSVFGRTGAVVAVSGDYTSSQVTNLSSVSGLTTTNALETLSNQVTGLAGTGSGNGYLSRHVYVNAASTKIGTTFAGVTVQAVVTYSVAADVPAGNILNVELAGSGGGGSGGNRGTGDGFSGTGGGGGARRSLWFPRSEVIAALPVVISAALGGNAGVGATTVNLVTTVTCTAGSDGGAAAFGSFTAGGGSGGQIGTAAHAGSGGGIANAPTPTNVSTALPGGAPSVTIGLPGVFLDGAGTVANGTTSPGLPSVYGGASGGQVASGSENSAAGGRSVYGGGGGGSGRACDNTVGAGAVGADGGGRWTTVTSTGGGGTGGPGTNGAGPPSAASPGNDGNATVNGDGGGGGGSNDGNTSPSMTAGAGGAGGFPGGGGGGGGATRTLLFSARTFVGGNGGKGGDAMVMVTAFL